MSIRYGMGIQIVPLMSPVDLGSTDTGSAFVNVRNANWVTFEIPFGTITGDTVVVTVEESTAASSGSEVAIPFVYRLSSPLGTDSWGAVTTCDSGGVTVAASDDDSILLIDVDPATLDAGYNYLRVWLNLGGSASAVEVAVIAHLEPRYPQTSPISSS